MGSLTSLEEMFDSARLSPNHVPGWKRPGVTQRAIPQPRNWPLRLRMERRGRPPTTQPGRLLDGRQEGWDILVGARGAAKDIIQKEKGVALDSVVKSGPVAGLGDKAIFSDILPSMVLKDNLLLEFTMPILSRRGGKVPPAGHEGAVSALTARVHGGFRLPV
jgi:hypothetical protein